MRGEPESPHRKNGRCRQGLNPLPAHAGRPPSIAGGQTITLDHQIFATLVAPPDLAGPRLAIAVALARWVILLGPAALAWLWIVGAEEDRSAAIAAGVAAVLASAGAALLSTLIVVPRPFMDGLAVNYLDHLRDSSFPSDHATIAFALAFALWLRRPPKLPSSWLPLTAVAVSVGWARVFLGAHYPSDIAGGALVGAAAVAVTATPLGRAALRRFDLLDEAVRSRGLAIWRRFASRSRAPGVFEP